MPATNTLPVEIIVEVFRNLPHYDHAIKLGNTCRHLHNVWTVNAGHLAGALLPEHPVFYYNSGCQWWSTWDVAVRLYDLRHCENCPVPWLERN